MSIKININKLFCLFVFTEENKLNINLPSQLSKLLGTNTSYQKINSGRNINYFKHTVSCHLAMNLKENLEIFAVYLITSKRLNN